MKASSLKKISRSELRHRILAALSPDPANSVTSLSQRLGVLRPSVSRSVKSLEEAGLITRQGRTVSLSEAGQEELSRLDAELSVKVKKSTNLASRILGQATEAEMRRDLEIVSNSSFLQLAETLANSPFLQLSEGLKKSSFSQLSETLAKSAHLHLGEGLANSSLFQLSETIANNPGLQVAKELASSSVFLAAKEAANSASLQIAQALEAINVTANIQTINLGLLQSWKQEAFSPLNHLVLWNNVHLSNMMVDLEALTNIGTAVSQSLGSLINQTAWTTKVYDTYFLDIISDFKQIPTFENLELSLGIPTTGAASLVGSTRRLVESETLSLSEEEPVNLYVAGTYTFSERYVVLTPKLEAYLKPLGQRFVDKWEGAWQTLYSGNKDHHSQATHSGRELLMQVLAHLAPDSVFSKEEIAKNGVKNKPTRKMRINHILGNKHKSSVELIDCMANTLDSMYDVLVGEAHRRNDNNHLDDTIIGQLAGLGALLIMLLSLHSNSKS
jgi:DNA-binding MarR family transcriptional regulator